LRPHRHPVTDILGDQSQPILVAPLVEEIRFVIKKVLDFLFEQEAGYALVLIHHCILIVTPEIPGTARQGRPPAPGRAGGIYRSALNSRLRGIDDGKPYCAAAR
jgi:hypothetical protein